MYHQIELAVFFDAYVPEELVERFDRLAKKHGRTREALLTEASEKHGDRTETLRKQPKQPPC